MQFNNSPNQVSDGPFLNLLNGVSTPAELVELDEIVGGFDLGAVLSTSMGLSPVAPDLTAQSGPSAQPILTPSTGQTVQTTSTTQTTPMMPVTPPTQMASTTQMVQSTQMVLVTPPTQTVSTTQTVQTTTQSTPMVPLTPLTQTVSTTQTVHVTPLIQLASKVLLGSTMFSDTMSSATQMTSPSQAASAMLAGQSAASALSFDESVRAAEEAIDGYARAKTAGKTEHRKKKDVARENVKLHQRLAQILHQKIVQKAANEVKMQAIQSKLKRPV